MLWSLKRKRHLQLKELIFWKVLFRYSLGICSRHKVHETCSSILTKMNQQGKYPIKRPAMFACCAADIDVSDGTGSKGHDTASHTRWFRIQRSKVPHTDFRKTPRLIFATPLSCLTSYLKLYGQILQMGANSITKYLRFSFHLPTLL